MRMTRIVPCLWFADQAEQAANFYTSIFSNSRIVSTTRYGTAGFEIHQRPAGSVMTVASMPFTTPAPETSSVGRACASASRPPVRRSPGP